MARKKFLMDWTKFFAKHLVRATVENAAKQNVVLTFAPATAVKMFSRNVAAEFTLAGKTVDTLTVSRTAGTVTVHVTVAYAHGDVISLVFNPTRKGDTVTTSITNNIP